MPSDLTSDNIRSRTFRVSRRGYDRNEVDRFRGDVADRIFRMEGQIHDLEAKVDQLGLNDVGLLGEELEKLGADIAAILEQAVLAATEIRKRAIEDADLWQTSVESATGVTAPSTTAPSDAAELQRLADDELAAARTESERLLGDVESQRLRLLDDMRGVARDASDAAGGDDHTAADAADAGEIDIDPEALSDDDAEGPIAGDAEDPTADNDIGDPYRRTWEDEAGVRIVPSSRVLDTGPIDADDMVAEVEQLRAGAPGEAEAEAAGAEDPGDTPMDGTPTDGDASNTHAPTPDMPSDDAADDASTGASIDDGGAESGEPSTGSGDDASEGPTPVTLTVVGSGRSRTSQLHPVEDPTEGPADESAEGSTADHADDRPDQPTDEDADGEVGGDDTDRATGAGARPAIGDLFASLRTPGADGSTEDATDGASPPAGPSDDDGGDDEPAPAATPSDTPDAVAATSTTATLAGPPEVTVDTATDLRDRLLLPIQNRALRGVKREIVELQNVALDGIRHGDGDWKPDAARYNTALAGSLTAAIDEAYAAGVVGAAEMVGAGTPPLVGSPTVAPGVFVDALVSAAGGAHDEEVEHDGGSRQVAAAVSRVFRAWRTDEAERRLRSTLYRAYHEGVLAGFAEVGVTAITTVTTGRRCAECDAVTDVTWHPGSQLPTGVVMPPAHPECVATFVPVPMRDPAAP